MSKSAKKARKQAKRELKKTKGVCLACGHPLRGRDAKCKGCKRISPLYAGTKSASALLVKSAGGSVTPIWKARGRQACPAGHRGGFGDRFCVQCGSPLALSQGEYLTWLGKTQAPGAGSFLAKQLAGEYDPARRRQLEGDIFKQATRRGEVIPFLLQVNGYSSLRQAVREESNQGLRALFEQAYYPTQGGGQAS